MQPTGPHNCGGAECADCSFLAAMNLAVRVDVPLQRRQQQPHRDIKFVDGPISVSMAIPQTREESNRNIPKVCDYWGKSDATRVSPVVHAPHPSSAGSSKSAQDACAKPRRAPEPTTSVNDVSRVTDGYSPPLAGSGAVSNAKRALERDGMNMNLPSCETLHTPPSLDSGAASNSNAKRERVGISIGMDASSNSNGSQYTRYTQKYQRIPEKYAAAIEEMQMQGIPLPAAQVLGELKRAFLPDAHDWPGDERMMSKIYDTRRKSPRGQLRMPAKYPEVITEMLRKNINVHPAIIVSELIHRFGNGVDNSLPLDWPGDSKINFRISR